MLPFSAAPEIRCRRSNVRCVSAEPTGQHSIWFFFGGFAELLIGRTDASIALLRQSLERNSSYGSARMFLIAALSLSGQYRESEYIVKPITAQLLVKALIGAPASDEGSRVSRKLGKLVAVIGSRGGVGATTLAIHLVLHLANQQSRRVMLLDLDLHTGDCALALKLKPTPGLREALANPLRIDSVVLDRKMAIHGERLFVLS
jgi:hypothetical protein